MPSKHSPLTQGIAAIRLIVQSGHSWGVSSLANRLGMPKSSAHRLLQNLIQLGFIQKIEETKRYTICADIFEFIHEIASHFGRNLSLSDCLEKAAQELGCSVYLNMLGRQDCYVIFATGNEGNTMKLGLRAPAFASSAGKVLIAQMDESQWLQYAPGTKKNSDKISSNQATERFIAQLKEAQTKEVAWNHRESDPNYVSLAASIREPFIPQPRLAVALLMPYEVLMTRDTMALEEAVLLLASELQNRIGLR